MKLANIPQVVVVVLNWNGAADTLECLASLNTSSYPSFRILVVDNGSSDDSVPRLLAAHPGLWLLETGSNLGFAGGNNVGIRAALAAEADIVLLLNNDTTVAPDWLERFVDASRTLPEGSVLGAKICYSGEPETIWHFGARWNEQLCRFQLMGRGAHEAQWPDVERADLIIGCCMWLPRGTIEAVGLLEEAFYLNYEETDWCSRARRVGFSLYSIPRVKVWHKISASFLGRPHNAYFVFRNRRLWVERQFEGDERLRVLRLLVYPDEARIRRKYWLRRLQGWLYRLVGRDLPAEAAGKLMFARAALAGVADYRQRRFGDCPEWVMGKGR